MNHPVCDWLLTYQIKTQAILFNEIQIMHILVMWFALSRTRRLGEGEEKSQFRMLKRWASREQKESIADKRSCKRRLVLLLQAVYRSYHLDWITIWLYMDLYVIVWTPELNIKSSSSRKETAVLLLHPHHLPLFRESLEYWIRSVGVALLAHDCLHCSVFIPIFLRKVHILNV